MFDKCSLVTTHLLKYLTKFTNRWSSNVESTRLMGVLFILSNNEPKLDQYQNITIFLLRLILSILSYIYISYFYFLYIFQRKSYGEGDGERGLYNSQSEQSQQQAHHQQHQHISSTGMLFLNPQDWQLSHFPSRVSIFPH